MKTKFSATNVLAICLLALAIIFISYSKWSKYKKGRAQVKTETATGNDSLSTESINEKLFSRLMKIKAKVLADSARFIKYSVYGEASYALTDENGHDIIVIKDCDNYYYVSVWEGRFDGYDLFIELIYLYGSPNQTVWAQTSVKKFGRLVRTFPYGERNLEPLPINSFYSEEAIYTEKFPNRLAAHIPKVNEKDVKFYPDNDLGITGSQGLTCIAINHVKFLINQAMGKPLFVLGPHVAF